MTFYSDLAATAVELLAEFGIDMVLEIETGSYQPGGIVVSSTSTETVKGVLLDYSQTERDGTMIRQEDQRVYLSPDLKTEPKTGHKLIIDGKKFEVVQSKPLKPTDTVLLHEVQVRR